MRSSDCVYAFVCVYVCARVRACVLACACIRAHVCACMCMSLFQHLYQLFFTKIFKHFMPQATPTRPHAVPYTCCNVTTTWRRRELLRR